MSRSQPWPWVQSLELQGERAEGEGGGVVTGADHCCPLLMDLSQGSAWSFLGLPAACFWVPELLTPPGGTRTALGQQGALSLGPERLTLVPVSGYLGRACRTHWPGRRKRRMRRGPEPHLSCFALALRSAFSTVQSPGRLCVPRARPPGASSGLLTACPTLGPLGHAVLPPGMDGRVLSSRDGGRCSVLGSPRS